MATTPRSERPLAVVAAPPSGRLLSVNVGMPEDIDWEGRVVRTAIWKHAVEGRRWVRRLNVDGDGQGDLEGHGGVNRAVFVYQIESYRYWEQFLGRDDFVYGQFGENFTVEGLGLADDEVCIGDRYRVGSALFEVTQPRVTCYRIGIRMTEPSMASLLVAHHRPGFYLRVLEEGEVAAGDDVELVARGAAQMSVAEIDGLLYLPHRSRRDLLRALRIPALSQGWQGSFAELLDQADNGGVTELAWEGLRALRVVAIDHESLSVVSVELVPADGRPVAPPLAGQFLTLRLRPDPNGASLLRTYSLSGAPSPDRYRVSVKRDSPGAASNYIHTSLRVGDLIEAGAPRGSFVLRTGEGPVVLISAGVGATPVLSMLHVLAGARSPREVWWLHGARNAAEEPFAEETGALLSQLTNAHRLVCFSNPGAGDQDFDVTGRLTPAVLDRVGVPLDADFYLCGPPSFMRDIGSGLAARGVGPERVAKEVFGPGESLMPGVIAAPTRSPHQPQGEPGTGPLVSFGRSNLSVPWQPAFTSLLELAESCDVPVRFACRTGVCHTCVTGLVDGAVEYSPEPLEPPAPGEALICCSRPAGEVTLDL